MTCARTIPSELLSGTSDNLVCYTDLLKEALSIVPLHTIPDKRLTTWRMAAQSALASYVITYAIEVGVGLGLWMENDDPRRLQLTDNPNRAFRFNSEQARSVLDSLDLSDADWSLNLVKHPRQG